MDEAMQASTGQIRETLEQVFHKQATMQISLKGVAAGA